MKTPQFIRTTLLLAGLSIALCGTSARAQYEDGSLIGSIHDATGAAVPNAAITVTNIDTGNVIHVSATSSGDYEIPSLRVGLYNIEATAPSFAPAEARNITVSVASRERIDLTLKVGNADATTVEVSDVALQMCIRDRLGGDQHPGPQRTPHYRGIDRRPDHAPSLGLAGPPAHPRLGR